MSLHDLEAREVRRQRLVSLVAVCVVALALVGLARVAPADAGASSSFAQWYQASPENRFHFWYASDPRNAAYFHVREHFGSGELGDQAVRVALCESNLEPGAVNGSSGASGVFQVMPQWADRFAAVTGRPFYDERFNPDANARFAAWLVAETGGWSHWVCRGAA